MVEDFTTYTEVDIAADRIRNLSANSVQMYDVDFDETVYLYKDYGVGNIPSGRKISFYIKMESALASSRAYSWGFANAVGEWYNAAGPAIGVRVRRSGSQWQFSVGEKRTAGGIGVNSYTHGTGGADEEFWMTVTWIGTSLTLDVYTDAARTALAGSANRTLELDYTFRYAYALRSEDLPASGYSIRFTIEDLDLNAKDNGSANLKAEFTVRYETEDLFSEFVVRYTATPLDLYAEFQVAQWEDLYAKFVVPYNVVKDLYAKFTVLQGNADLFGDFLLRETATGDLYAELDINQENGSQDLMAKFGVVRIYDLSGSGGIGFMWKGVGRGHVDFQMITPTGAWTGKFPDYGPWTWVELKWEDLQEVDIDGSRPDKTRITGILWTVHIAGDHHVDNVLGLPKGGDRVVFMEFTVRHADVADLPAEFVYNHYRSDLFAEIILQQNSAKQLKATFVVRYGKENLKAVFEVGQDSVELKATFILPESVDLFGKFRVEPHKNLKAVFSLRQLTGELSAEFRVRGENLEVYTIPGISGNQSINFASGEVTVLDMTKDLVCVAGDKIVVSFDSTIQYGSDSNNRGVEAWLDVDGVQVGEKLWTATDLGGNKRFIMSFTRVYEIPSNGTYTIEIKAQNPVSTATYSFYANNRTLSIQHFG